MFEFAFEGALFAFIVSGDRFVLFALLLFSAPAGVTLRTLFAFHGFGDMTAPYIITAECCR